jgi:hypothetical protein
MLANSERPPNNLTSTNVGKGHPFVMKCGITGITSLPSLITMSFTDSYAHKLFNLKDEV